MEPTHEQLTQALNKVMDRWRYANSKIAEHPLPEGVKDKMNARFNAALTHLLPLLENKRCIAAFFALFVAGCHADAIGHLLNGWTHTKQLSTQRN